MIIDLSKIKWTKGSYDLPEAYLRLTTPSVTTIINDTIPDPELEAFIKAVGEEKAKEIMQNAAYRGTAMHLFIEHFIKDLTLGKDPTRALNYTRSHTVPLLEADGIPKNKINEGLDLFYKFYYSDYSQVFTRYYGIEYPIYSKSRFYRGKLDIFYGDPVTQETLTDFKTASEYIKKGSTKEKKYKCQLGGYVYALEEMLEEKGIKIKKAYIMCVNTKTDILQEVAIEGDELDFYKNEFKTLAAQWHIKNNQEFLIN